MNARTLEVLKSGFIAMLFVSAISANAIPAGPLHLPPPSLAAAIPAGPLHLPPPSLAAAIPAGPLHLPPPTA